MRRGAGWVCTLCVVTIGVSGGFYCRAADASAPGVVLLTVGRCTPAPAIDGRLAPAEWDNAATGSGLVVPGTHDLLPVQPRFWLAFDDAALYFAAAVPMVEGAAPTASHRDRDSAVYEDDSIELILDPGLTRTRYYQFVLNSAGGLFDADAKGAAWNAKGVQCAGGVSGREWVVEIAVPFAAMEVTAPAAGVQWGANVCLNYPSRGKLLGSWGKVKGGFREPANFGVLVFTGSGPVAGVSGLETLLSGRGELRLVLRGGSPAASSLRIWPRKDATKPVVDVQRPAADAWALPFSLPEPTPGAVSEFYEGEVNVVRGDLLVLSLPFTFRVGAPMEMQVRVFPDTGEMEVALTVVAGLLEARQHACRLTVAEKGGTAARVVQDVQLAANGPTTAVLRRDEIPTGDITVGMTVADRTGKVVFTQTRDLTDPFNPWWLTDNTGTQDVILPPYQPLRVEADAVCPWGRSYRFGPCVMPVEVQTAGASILAGPVALRTVVGGRRVEWTGAAPTMTEVQPGRVLLQGQAECEALRLAGTARVEYDGMIRVDFELSPVGDPTVDELTLEVPLKPEYAQYLYHFPGEWGSVANAGLLPAEGFKGQFRPYVWLGDNDRGFAWFCESAENWLPEDRKDAVTVDREKDRVVLRLHLLRGERVGHPLKYTFGFQATPVKQPEKTVWDYRICHAGNYGIQNQPAGSFSSSIDYPALGNIRGDQGTAEMWFVPPVDSDPARADDKNTKVPNVTLLWLDVDPATNCGLFWCGPPQVLRIWVRVDGNVVTTLDAPAKWKRGEWHHAAFSWGDGLRIYLDGELRASKPFKGLMTKELTKATLSIGKSGAPVFVDEIRISSQPRTPELAAQPYVPDASTLLLDHLDLDVRSLGESKTQPAKAAGGPGILGGSSQSGPGKYGKAIQLRADKEGYSFLDQLADYGVRTLCFHMQWSWGGYPMPLPGREQDLRDLVKACHAKGIQLLLYGSPLTADEAPEWDLYHDYFLIAPLKWPFTYREGHVAPAACWQSHYRNLWLARQARLVEEYDIDGFYLDGSEWPLDCQNMHHGCGYKRQDGKIGTTCNIFGTRDYMKRLYVAVKSRRPDAQINIHNSTVMVIPTLGWGTSSWDGEQLGSLSWDKGGVVEKQGFALEALPLPAFRAEFMGRQWGVPSELLCYERPYTTPQLLSITLLHNVLVRCGPPHLARMAAIWRLYDTFGMKEATWYPYWSNGDIFRTNSEQVKVSAYRHPRNGLLMLISNLSAKGARAEAQFDMTKLDLKPEGLKAVDAVSGEPVELTPGKVSFEMEPFSYHYIRVSRD